MLALLKKNVHSVSLLMLGAGCVLSRVLAAYLGYEPQLLWTGVLSLLFFGATYVLVPRVCSFELGKHSDVRLKRWQVVLLTLVSACLSASIVVSAHIHIGNATAGTVVDNYIEPFSVLDAVAFIAIAAHLSVVLVAAAVLLLHVAHKVERSVLPAACCGVDRRFYLILFFVFFVAWIPYLLVYWPGLVFGDTVSSLSQALYIDPLSNHHPVLLALMLRGCIGLTGVLGFGTTIGVGLFTFLQLVLMACCFSYACSWFSARLGLSRLVSLFIALLLALSPYVASYSVALWKDPLFSCALLLLVLFVFDCSLGVVKNLTPARAVALALLELATMFMRNNGLYVVLVVAAVLALEALLSRDVRRRLFTVLFAITACCVAANVVVSGPVYTACGVKQSDKVESLGIPLAQMARVVAADGDMSAADAAYMDSLLPTDRYKDAYHPCLIDTLKWDDEFNGKALEEGFWSHWISMLSRNPRAYFDAWVLQTFGYWTVNQPQALSADWNIDAGVPYNGVGSLDWLGVYPANLLHSDGLKQVFSCKGTSIPCGIVFWGVLLMAVLLAVAGRARYAAALLPVLALIGTLFVAAPIWYWPRYVFAAQLALPSCAVYSYLVVRYRSSRPQDGDVAL